ncbi:retinaldehyde-binding protein 1-like [Uloborus diversus]|uniref:retinaldehyde-binding protein 1-like n=1 Tax=Uloborus diversus TaxID=327109 RepID=UPI002409989F|nr:retinaldehyde-binding protein 1-like [Uloborus diversus]XP_054714806.1 retinaldehyde-binding protein 1-like [Uloborus diversus]XP_054714807.1 retinaldehyde-binding protein 1-like [Uloborus diversus]XP_054714808.1 retinaldehyde-binding protein 1-like [Uloborus diversus]XP_054714809.1 retinaldehyde-binding protein 1-like [Uloborus diversus]XP_054714810.1 retinaldehyde-binding protein 1-like [Uloborus diversus]
MDTAKTIVVGNKSYRPLLDEHLIPEDIRKAREELNETENSRVAVLKAFKEKLSQEKEYVPRTDDIYVLRFLRTRKFDCERSQKLMKEHYKFRAKHPAVFPAPSTIEKALRANIFNYLPHRDHLGRAIFVVKMALWDPDEIPYHEFVAVGNILSEYVLDNPVTQINGYVGLWDFAGFSLKQFIPFCSPKHIWLLSSLMQDRFPGRFKIAYCVNCHNLVNTAWNLFKPILKEKFRNRVKILGGDMKVLHQFFDPAILPVEFGGVQPPSDCEEIVEKVLKKEQYFNYNRKFGYQPKDKSHSQKA